MTQTYHADIVGEDRTEFVASTEAESHAEARGYFEEMYPEARIGGISTDAELQEIANARYSRFERDLEEGSWEADDYAY